ncbi:iron complex transport system substrate-binding protein [Paenibacillus phyllosphaerae]|uniref:High-affinity heme uptake system protein IsdE n=1 Tax=Paenibacillus phyllosphaerae TaxID=274593 RepID=A0A7W5B256_9BACL|nr:heme ABC transporter substrate-binding protein IsdE [Paenibacillus phyllosphaerae]MBB3112456.1 iron complex transport system substrate-binding protein [Paenibacillus phyllosphaerae]
MMSFKLWRSTAVLAITLLVAGCSSNTSTENSSAENSGANTSKTTEVSVTQAADEVKDEVKEDYRIVSTTVATTQFFDLLDLDLVGIPTSVKELPKRYDGITKIGNPMTPNMEVVKSLDPTEVFSVTTLEYDLAPVFKNAAIKSTFLDFTSLAKMNAAILDIGKRYNREEKAQTIVDGYNAKVEEIKQKVAGKPQPTVLILLGVPGSYLVATENSYIGDLVRLVGGKNIVQGEDVEYLASNTEYLQQSNPDVILRAAHGMPEEVVKMFDQEFQENDIWKHFNAVQQGRVYDLPEELFPTTANMAVAEALDAMVDMLYAD